jgi:hypothetical protein
MFLAERTGSRAREALLLLLMPPSDSRPVMKAIEFFDELEIYPGNLDIPLHSGITATSEYSLPLTLQVLK